MYKEFTVYVLASRIGGTLYIGVTNDLIRRVTEHRKKLVSGFTKKYEVTRLVYFERFSVMRAKRSAARNSSRTGGGERGRYSSLNNPIRIGLTSTPC